MNESKTHQYTVRTAYYQNNRGAQYSWTYNGTISWTESRSGSGVRGWKSKIKHLQNASSDYSRLSAVKISPGSSSMKVTITEFKKYPTGTLVESYSGLILPLPGAPSSLPKANELALGNFLSNASAAVAPLKGMVVLGELRETLKMLKRPASALRDGFTHYNNIVRRRISAIRPSRQKARIVKEVITGTYLEYVYGWQPLLSDIKAATQVYQDFMKKKDVVPCFGKATAETSYPSDQLSIVNHVGNFIDFVETTKCVRSSSVRYVGVIDLKKSGFAESASQRVLTLSGFSLAEFVPTVWELLPYSFVVDYFSNIGDILNSYYGLASSWVYVSRTQKDSVKTTVQRQQLQRVEPGESGTVSYDEVNSPGVIERSNFRRDSPPLRLPLLTLELPGPGWVWTNLAALVGQRVRL